MTDHPIIFSAPMVRALLDGRKTQTRRVLKPQPSGIARAERIAPKSWTITPEADRCVVDFKAPTYAPGDRLYVRESIARQETDQGIGYQTFAADGRQVWPLTRWYHKRNSVPSIHMPRWASRLTLTVTDVRVQRLQDISEADALAEGCDAALAMTMQRDNGGFPGNPRAAFQDLWNSLHGPDAWDASPWVVALTFTVQHGNIDKVGQ